MVKIPVCPKCKSTNVRLASSAGGWLIPEQWICNDCDYMGFIIAEIDTEDKDSGKRKL